MIQPKLSPFGRAIFDEAKADLESRKAWAEVDKYALEAYALELQTYFELLAEVQAEGVAVDTGTGSVKSNPKTLRLESALKNSVQLARLLGIGSDSRKKLGVAIGRTEKEPSEAMKLFRIAKG